uniref:Zinc transporter n=1 Tax=Leersia perrieri TaxID=77586 RepID=A0A0D9WF55_9ORYZ
MDRRVGVVVLFCLFFVLVRDVSAVAETEIGDVLRVVQKAPDRELESAIKPDGSKSGRVSVSTVAWSTLAMAAATGLGALPFFFLELEAQWAGLCNGLAAGVMLAASFDLVQEGQAYGSGSWVVFGILSGGFFIWLCKKFLEQYGEVSMLDIKVHNIPEGLAVSMLLSSKGVSPQKAMIWSIITSLPQPIVAVPAFLCADAFQKVLPFCTGFAAGCMIWIVIAEVLPDAFKEAAPSQVASAGTLAVAFMETLGTVLQGFTDGHNSEDTAGFLVSLVFGLGPLFGGIVLVAFSITFSMPHPLLTGVASGIAFRLAAWRPLQLLMSSKMGLFTTLFLLIGGSLIYHVATSNILRIVNRKKSSVNVITSSSGLSLSVLTMQSLLACGSVFLHAYAEGLQLGVAARKAYGLGRYMVLPVSLHGLPRGAAVASCIYGATDSWRAALAAAALTGFAGPSAAISAILAKIDYNGLDYWMVIACGALIPSFGRVFRRSLRLDMRKSICGLLIGFAFASVCLMSTRFICLHTPYCNSAPEAVT